MYRVQYREKDSSFCVDITSTKDGKFVTVNSNLRTSSEEGTYLSPMIYVLCLEVAVGYIMRQNVLNTDKIRYS